MSKIRSPDVVATDVLFVASGNHCPEGLNRSAPRTRIHPLVAMLERRKNRRVAALGHDISAGAALN